MPSPSPKHFASKHERAPQETVVELKIELRFADGVQVNPQILTKQLGDAIYEYDDRNMLLPGQRRPRGDERLVGTKIGVERTTREESLIARILRNPDPQQPYGFRAFEKERDEITAVSNPLTLAIEQLMNAEGKLGEAYEMLLMSEEHEAAEVRRKAKAIVMRVTKEATVAAILGTAAASV